MIVNYNWLKEYVGNALPEASKVDALLTEHAFEIEGVEEVAGETVIDVDVLPNRSSDCLCHRGIARELATILDTQLEKDPLSELPTLTETDEISVNIADTNACPRFTASLVTGIKVGESPEWLKTRLESLGQRSINNIVDATNYVMYAMGQPLHAYDADLFPQVDGKWQFGVRYGNEGEIVEILPEGGSDKVNAEGREGALGYEPRQVECKGTELLIVDESSNTPIGLAGVKGGNYAGVHTGTTNIIIEAAHFHPTITRKTARRLGIVIDASKRFENECSRELPPYGQFEIIELIKQIAGGEYKGSVDVYPEKYEATSVEVRVSKTNALLGLELTQDQIQAIIVRTGSSVEVKDVETLTCVGPFERTDLLIEEDFIEEVGRLYGLSNIVSIVPDTDAQPAVNPRQYYSEKVRQTLLGLGFSEVITSSFQKKDQIQLRNALASDKSYVRSSLAKNMHKVLDENFSHTDLLGIRCVQAFEIGTVFSKTETGVGEHLALAIGVRQKGNGYTLKDDAPLKAAIEKIQETLGVNTPVNWSIEKGVAEIDLSAVISELPVPEKYEEMVVRDAATYTPVSSYPSVARDIALWVSEGTSSDEVMSKLSAPAGDLCVRIDLFDEFSKDGKTSYAFRLVFQSKEKTLTDTEIGEVMDAINVVVEEQGWKVR